jgi:hypothetical protein
MQTTQTPISIAVFPALLRVKEEKEQKTFIPGHSSLYNCSASTTRYCDLRPLVDLF